MDPVGAAASLITLVDVAIKSFKITKSLVQRYRNASADLLDLKQQLDGIYGQLLLLRQLQLALSVDGLLLTDVEVEYIQKFLENTSLFLFEIHKLLEQQSTKSGKTARIKWALHDASKVKEWEDQLRRQSNRLATVLQLLNIRYSSVLQEELGKTKTIVTSTHALMARPQSCRQTRFSWATNTFGEDWILPHIVQFGGSVLSIDEAQGTAYTVSLRLHALFCLKTFCLDWNFRHSSPFSVQISAIGTGITVRNIVLQNSEIIMACKKGEVSSVWTLLQARKASVYDITPENFPPLRYAIESGSLELVSFLLNNGADPNATFGQFQTSPLECAFAFRQIAIARLLVAKGADVHHLSAKGWTPSFGLFGATSNHLYPCEEYFQMLSGASFDRFDAQDSEGWSVMHRAAAFGNADQIRALIRWHAPVDLKTFKLSWPPIFLAVQFGNLSTFNELRQHEVEFLSLKDVRNWTLLHVAVNAGRLDVMKSLMKLGADLHVRTLATESCVPKELIGLSLTPLDLARLRGYIVFTNYVNTLEEMEQDIAILKDEESDIGEVFWPALEVIVEDLV